MRNMQALSSRLLELKFLQHQRNAFNAGKEWTLTFDEYMKAWGEGICAYSGVRMTFNPNQSNTASIERKDNSKGYHAGNVVFVCWHLNRAKSNLPFSVYKKECKRVAAKI